MTPRRAAILREIGLAPLWRWRDAGEDAPDRGDAAEAAVALDAEFAPSASPAPAASQLAEPGVVPTAAAPRARSRLVFEDAGAPPRVDGDTPAGPPRAVDRGRDTRIATLDWDALEAEIRACGACRLSERRTQAVPGVGDRDADWMFVGEGPGAEEDQRGEPFVGAAGKLLDAMLATIGLKRSDSVYIANAVKCRPPHNRTPERDEVSTCFPYLARQIELVRPRVLIALGRPAAQALLNAEVSIAASRGKAFRYRDIPVVVTYHPAYLLRNQADKAKVWEDLCFARRLMRDLPAR